jgi:stage II sporulation SpoAA-like protein
MKFVSLASEFCYSSSKLVARLISRPCLNRGAILTMSYQLTIEEKPRYLHLTATGTHTAENARRFLFDAYEASLKRNSTAVLLELNFVGSSLPAGRIFDIVTEGSRRAAQLRRIAYVDRSSERDPTSMQFAATVAMNRGVNVQLFRDLESAERWLCANDENQTEGA